MNKIIVSFNGRLVGEHSFDGSQMKIGRGVGNDIRIDNPAVSSSHARIVRERDSFYIEDMKSTNGTFLNGKKITRSIINTRDDIKIGKHHLKLGWKQGTGEYDVEEDDGSGKVIPSLDSTMLIAQDTSKDKGKIAKDLIGGFALLEEGKAKKTIDMKERVTTIGKSSNAQIKIKGLLAPKVAALINRTDRGYVITSGDAKKPPLINGNPLAGPTYLKNGDMVEVFGVTLRFYLRK